MYAIIIMSENECFEVFTSDQFTHYSIRSKRMKSNFFKKATTAIVAVMSLASAAMITVGAADYTGNYHDKYFAIQFTGSGTNPHTKSEEKRNTTSAYIRSEDYSVSSYSRDKYTYSVEVYGINGVMSQGEGDSFAYNSNIGRCTAGSPVTITPGSWSYLPNWVAETKYTSGPKRGQRKYNNAFLVLWQKKESSVVSHGAWSPDSI